MVIYYVIVILAFLLSIFDLAKSNHLRWTVYTFFCVILVLFVGLRDLGVDNDSVNYSEAFNFGAATSWRDLILGDYDETMERGYLILNKIIFTLGGNIHTVFLVMAALTGLINYVLIYKKSPYPFCSLLVYVCFFFFYRDFTQIRFSFAAAMSMWVLFEFLDKRYLNAVLLVTTATFFQSAALVMPLLILLYFVGRNYWIYFFLPFVGLVGSFYEPVEILFGLGGLPPTLAQYVELDEIGRGGYVISAIAQVFMLAVMIFKQRLLRSYSKQTIDLMFIALSLGSFINLLFISFAIMQRLALLLFGVIVFLMPYIFRIFETHGKDKYTGLFLRFIFMLFVLYYGLNMIDPELMRPYEIR